MSTAVFLHELSALPLERREEVLGSEHAYQGVFRSLIEESQQVGLVWRFPVSCHDATTEAGRSAPTGSSGATCAPAESAAQGRTTARRRRRARAAPRRLGWNVPRSVSG